MRISITTKWIAFCGFVGVLISISHSVLAQSGNTNDARAEVVMAETDAKREDTRKLIAAMGTEDSLKHMFPRLLNQLKVAMPQVPDNYWQEWQTNLNFNEVIEIYVQAYDKYFTHEEITSLTQYYESPLGKKFVTTMPKVTDESMAALNALGTQLADRIQKRLQPEHATVPSSTNLARSREEELKANLTNPEFRAFALRQNGYDPEKYELSNDGHVTPKVAVQSQPESEPAETPSQRLPPDVKYFITVDKADGKSDIYLSKEEPVAYGTGFKFRAYPNSTEIIVSGNVTVRKLGPNN